MISLDYGQQYTTVTQKPIQSTYRPSTVSTQAPRETYIKQEPVYEQRPVNSYNPEYDEALISQVIMSSVHFRKEIAKILDFPFLVGRRQHL